MEFCHIGPSPMLDKVLSENRTTYLTLAHIIDEGNDDYINFYLGERREAELADKPFVNIMDNSAFELYKAKLPMFPPEKLVSLAQKIKATHIVLPDHPGMPSMVGIDDAKRYAPVFKKAGFKTFFVPQSDVGDLEDLITSFAWAASSPLIDYIGISILAVPNAYKCEKGNQLQRFVSRWKFMNELQSRGLLGLAAVNRKKIHFLGMVDGPNEIQLVRDFSIDTWDSSAAIWAGLNGIAFDDSPTGLFEGKFEQHVDFDFETDDNELIEIAQQNVRYIDRLVKGFNRGMGTYNDDL